MRLPLGREFKKYRQAALVAHRRRATDSREYMLTLESGQTDARWRRACRAHRRCKRTRYVKEACWQRDNSLLAYQRQVYSSLLRLTVKCAEGAHLWDEDWQWKQSVHRCTAQMCSGRAGQPLAHLASKSSIRQTLRCHFYHAVHTFKWNCLRPYANLAILSTDDQICQRDTGERQFNMRFLLAGITHFLTCIRR